MFVLFLLSCSFVFGFFSLLDLEVFCLAGVEDNETELCWLLEVEGEFFSLVSSDFVDETLLKKKRICILRNIMVEVDNDGKDKFWFD